MAGEVGRPPTPAGGPDGLNGRLAKAAAAAGHGLRIVPSESEKYRLGTFKFELAESPGIRKQKQFRSVMKGLLRILSSLRLISRSLDG